MATIDSASAPRPTARRLAGFALACGAGLALIAALLGAGNGAGATSPQAATGLVWHTDLEAAQAAAVAGDKKILVNLYASWCGWCRRLDQTVFSSDEFHRYSDRFVLLKLDVEKDEDGPAVKSRYRTSGVPVTLVLTSGLEPVLAINGFLPLERFIERVDTAVERYDGQRADLGTDREVRPWS